MSAKDDRETFIPASAIVGHITQPTNSRLREAKRSAIREWLHTEGCYSQGIAGGPVDERTPLTEVLVDGWVNFEKLLDRLDTI